MSTHPIQAPFSLRDSGRASLPREAAWRRVGRAVWREIEAIGHQRAELELNRLAMRWENTDPELASQLREASRQQA